MLTSKRRNELVTSCLLVILASGATPVSATDPVPEAATSVNATTSTPRPDAVKVAAVQISGYDKGDLPRENYDPTASIAPYIDRAGQDGAQLVVFPEYVLGHITVPGPATDKVSAAAARNRIYVIAGCWEERADGTFANAALLFGRDGQIIGRYLKTHAAVDHFEGDPPWSRPPRGKDKAWFLQNDPEWAMQKGGELPVFDLDFGRIGIMTFSRDVNSGSRKWNWKTNPISSSLSFANLLFEKLEIS